MKCILKKRKKRKGEEKGELSKKGKRYVGIRFYKANVLKGYEKNSKEYEEIKSFIDSMIKRNKRS
ncbi:MAG: hypothetical protein IJN64_10995 [Lachnospiraceae bacterium]|nr:hypothetical protein [Lachnospiraceae bacterium]